MVLGVVVVVVVVVPGGVLGLWEAKTCASLAAAARAATFCVRRTVDMPAPATTAGREAAEDVEEERW